MQQRFKISSYRERLNMVWLTGCTEIYSGKSPALQVTAEWQKQKSFQSNLISIYQKLELVWKSKLIRGDKILFVLELKRFIYL